MQFFDENYNLTDTTTSPILLEDVVEGTAVYEGKTTGGVKVQEGENKVYQDNVAYITEDAGKKQSEEMFNLLYLVQTQYGSKKNKDGSAFIQWSDAQGNPITFNSLDEWNKLPESTQFQLLESYDKLKQEGHPFLYMDDNFDLNVARHNVTLAANNFNYVSKIHGGYMKQAAAKADGQIKEQEDPDKFSYHSALLDENGTPVSEEKYNNIVRARYNNLTTEATLIHLAPAFHAYAKELAKEVSDPNYQSPYVIHDNTELNEAVYNAYTNNGAYDPNLMISDQDPKAAALGFSSTRTKKQVDDGNFLKRLYSSSYFKNNNVKNSTNQIFANLYNSGFGQLNIGKDAGVSISVLKEREELFNNFVFQNDLYRSVKYKNEEGKEVLRKIPVKYDDVIKSLDNSKERQTYANTYSKIIQAYNDPTLSKSITKLKDRYQYIIDAGLANVQRDVPIKYDFNIDNYKHKNYTTLGNIFGLLKKTYEKGANVLNEKGYKFAFGVNSNDMQNIGLEDKTKVAGNEETIVFNADDETTQGKYLKQIIPYMTDLIKDDNSKGTIEYREFLSKEDMGNYEVYTIKFNPKFLDNEEFNKVKFIQSDEESTKIKNDIITKFKENGLTIYVPKDLAQRKLLPSIERKNALTVSPIEQAISDRGMYEVNIPRAGNIKVVKDEAANLWRVTGSYLVLNDKGKYDVTPFNDSFEINHDGKMKTPYDVDRLINARINNFRQYYKANTQIINKLNENGINIGQDIYTYDGR